MNDIVATIGDFCDCKTYNYTGNTVEHTFFGTEKDVKIAEYMFYMIQNSVEAALKEFKKNELDKLRNKINISTKTITTSFKKGMIDRIFLKLTEMIDERKRDIVEMSDSTSMVLYNRKDIVEEEFSKFYTGDIVKASKYGSNNISAIGYTFGFDAGANVSLSKGIE